MYMNGEFKPVAGPIDLRGRRRLNPNSMRVPRYPEQLPITGRRGEIIAAIRAHPVIILCGDTGSGKSTQIPKMCLEAAGERRGLIGCTQPRRIAALTLAARIGEELGEQSAVGCRIRFHDSTGPENRIRMMTDGILLSEAVRSPSLRAYHTIVVDEAHERSLNIDVLLGLLHDLIERRRDLKLIITSATLDTEKFAAHFGGAPIIEVSGRTYPVEVRYEPPEEEEAEKGNKREAALSWAERASDGVERIVQESPRGDILVFLPTEQEIRDAVEIIRGRLGGRLDVLPLYARLPTSEQKKVFASGGRRKVVAATNVAETSLTIPGIRYVVDSGTARISRYNPGTGTRGLPVEAISRSSADQRAGRCGRVEDGVCIRLYSEEDYRSRPEYTAPEIQRTNLAELILRLLEIGIEKIESFPFVDAPEAAAVRDGLRTLREIGALADEGCTNGGKSSQSSRASRQLSDDGRLMARLPLDPRLARMLIQADREDCLGDVLPIAASLSVRDPRETPPEKRGSAEAAHAKFRDERSDFAGLLNIWEGFRRSGIKGGYTGKLKRFCRENYLSFPRMREWMDIHQQLTLLMEENGYRIHRSKMSEWEDKRGEMSARYTAVHRSVLSGLLSHAARRAEDGGYDASRNRRAFIHPGSGLRKSRAEWIVAAELVRTSRLFARSAAEIDPSWLADMGAHLVKKSWVRPRWSQKKGAVTAEEQVRLFGFLIADSAVVPYGEVNPVEAREIFIRRALVEGDLGAGVSWDFLAANEKLRRRFEGMQAKLRRRDLLAGEDAMFAFYDARLPAEVLDRETLNRALNGKGQAKIESPREKPGSPPPFNLDKHLRMAESDILTGVGVGADKSLAFFPDTAMVGGEKWKLSYIFDPDSAQDGVTLKIPPGRLGDLPPGGTDWMVPGLLTEKAEALIRGLPKDLRKRLIPAAETAAEAVSAMKPEGDFLGALSQWLYRERGIDIPPNSWNLDSLPRHLRIRLALLDESGREAAAARGEADLKTRNTRQSPPSAHSPAADRHRRENERIGLTAWAGDIPASVPIAGGGLLHPALTDDGSSVSLRFFDDKSDAEARHLAAQKRLALIYWAGALRELKRRFRLTGEARGAAVHLGGAAALEEALWERLITDIFASAPVRLQSEWEDLLEKGGAQMYQAAPVRLRLITQICETYAQTRRALGGIAEKQPHRRSLVKACLADAESLVKPDLIRIRPITVWEALPRWLKAVLARAERGCSDPMRERRFGERWNPLRDRLAAMTESLSPMASREKRAAIDEAAIMMEELRVSLCAAGQVKPAMKISESRAARFLDEIERML